MVTLAKPIKSRLGVYCGIDAHTLCARVGCTCRCHYPPAPPFKAPRPAHRADAVYDTHGRRVCPGCATILVRKNPHGPGRYPTRCAACR